MALSGWLLSLVRTWYMRLRGVLPRPLPIILDTLVSLLRRAPVKIRHADLAGAKVRRWFDHDRLFIGWLLSGDENTGSTRVRGLLPHGYLRREGVHSVILSKNHGPTSRIQPEEIEQIVSAGFDVVVFQRVFGEDAQTLARVLRAAGTKTVYAAGDRLRTTMPEVVDRVVVASEALTELVRDRDTVSVIEAMIETSTDLCKDYSRRSSGSSIKVVWVGYPENLHLLTPVKEALQDSRLANYELITISRGPGVTLQWDRKHVWRQILECDIAVLPSIDTKWYAAKPNTRMIMFKALGLPIVASPVASYVATLTHGRSCYFARDVREWTHYLAALSDFERRREIGLADRDQVIATYGLDAIGRRWLDLFKELAGRSYSSHGR